MTQTASLAWAAGVFEGEGSFIVTKRNEKRAQLVMTDEDIVRRFHETVGVGKVYGPYGPYGREKKVRWEWRTSAHGALKVAAALYPLLGERRRAQAEHVMV